MPSALFTASGRCAVCHTYGELPGFVGNELLCEGCSPYLDCAECGRAFLVTEMVDVDGYRTCEGCGLALATRLAQRGWSPDPMETEVGW